MVGTFVKKLQCVCVCGGGGGQGGNWGLMIKKHFKHKKVTFLLAFVGLILCVCV